MNNSIKLGLLSSLLSATLLADVKVVSSAKVISQMQTDIALKLTDTETNKPLTSNVDFDKLDVDKGSKIGRMKVLSNGDYTFSITRKAGCNKSANPAIKGVFSTTINGKKVQVPYDICKKIYGFVETQHPYKNKEKVEMILEGSYGHARDNDRGYFIRIFGETEANYDFVTFTDMSGKVLEGRVLNDKDFGYKVRKLRFSGNFSKKNVRKGKGGAKANTFYAQDATYIFIPRKINDKKLKVKVLFTSDSSVTKEGVKIDMTYSFPM